MKGRNYWQKDKIVQKEKRQKMEGVNMK